MKRFEIPRSALHLLARHADQFRELIARDYEEIFGTVIELCDHKNKGVKEGAFGALNAIMKELSASIVDNGKDHPQSIKMFRYLFRLFHDMMENPNSDARKVSIAIRGWVVLAHLTRSVALTTVAVQPGMYLLSPTHSRSIGRIVMVAARYGHLAAPCQLLMDDGNLIVMFHSMAKRAEQIYLNDDTALSEEAMYVIVGCADACCFSWHSHFILRSLEPRIPL